SQGQRLEGPALEVAQQGEQVRFEVALEPGNTLLVNPGHAPVTPDLAEGPVHEVEGDSPGQRMSFDLGHVRSFRAEPRETNSPGSMRSLSRGDRFLAGLAMPARGAGALKRARRLALTCLMDRTTHPPLPTDAPFTMARQARG